MIYVHKRNSEKYRQLERKAMRLGSSTFGISTKGDYKYYVIYNGKTVHFGNKYHSDFTHHQDIERRDRYRARHGKIKTKSGELAYLNKNQASYWAWHLLW